MKPPGNYKPYSLPQISDAEVERVGRVWTIDIAHDQRAGLDDAVDDTLVKGKVVDAERLVEIRKSRRQSVVQAMPHVDVQLLQLVEDVRQLVGSNQANRGPARIGRVEVAAQRVAVVVREPRFGVGTNLWRARVNREVVDAFLRVHHPVPSWIGFLRWRLPGACRPRPLVAG